MPREKKDLLDGGASMSAGGSAGKAILILLLIILFAGFIWYFMKYQEVKKQIVSLSSTQGQQELNQQEIDKILKEVGRHIILPEGETPTVATIEDAAALAEQQVFFKDSENGDKVLIYSDRAIIYSPDRDMLVNVGPVYFQGGQGENQPGTTDQTGLTQTPPAQPAEEAPPAEEPPAEPAE